MYVFYAYYVLLLVVFLVLCVFVISGVAYVYMYDFIVDWVSLHYNKKVIFANKAYVLV